MPYLEVRMWGCPERILKKEGKSVQRLSFSLESLAKAFRDTVSVDQYDCEDYALVIAERTNGSETYGVAPLDVMNSKELNELLLLFKSMPGTPANVQFLFADKWLAT